MKIPGWLRIRRSGHWMVIITIIILYTAWKIYVIHTPSPLDDELPDKVKDAVMIMVYDDDSFPLDKPDDDFQQPMYDKDDDLGEGNDDYA